MKKLINTKNIISVDVFDEYVKWRYDMFCNTYEGCKIPENHKLKNDLIYENPLCRFKYIDGSSDTFHFETFEDAVEFANRVPYGEWLHLHNLKQHPDSGDV